MIKQEWFKKLGLVASSVGFALLLFLTANLTSYKNTGASNQRVAETFTHTVEGLSVELKYDSDKYFISGHTAEVDVYLTSPNRLRLDSEINADTRTFKLVADLSNITEGTSKVPIEVRDLPSGMTASVSPANLTVTVGKKTVRLFDVSTTISEQQIDQDHQLESVKLSDTKVEVTTDEATMELIDRIGLALPENQILTDHYEGDLGLQAYAKDGKVLPASISPATVKVAIKLKKLTKSVPVAIELVGKMSDELSDIAYELEQSRVLVKGTKEALDKIDSITLQVDISEIKKDTTKQYKLALDGVKLTPDTIKVKVITTPATSEEGGGA